MAVDRSAWHGILCLACCCRLLNACQSVLGPRGVGGRSAGEVSFDQFEYRRRPREGCQTFGDHTQKHGELRLTASVLGCSGFPHAGQFLAAGFGVVQLLFASAVAVLFDEVAGFGELGPVAEEAGAVEVDVGEVERHRAALGDLLGLVEGRAGRRGIAADEVIQRGGEQAFGKVVQSCPRRGGR